MSRWIVLKLAVGTLLAWVILGCDPVAGTADGGTSEGGSTASALRSLDVAKLCARLVGECGQGGQGVTVGACTKHYTPLRVTPACAEGVTTVSCGELTSATSSISLTCFPRCTGAPPACFDDGTLLYCTDTGGTERGDCASACGVEGTTWSGTCGKSFGGRISASEQCWCQ